MRQWLIDARKKRGYSQVELAKAINMAQQHLSLLELGKSNLSFATACKLSKILKISLKKISEEELK